MRSGSLPSSNTDSSTISLIRRLQESPSDIAIRLVEHCGPRPATGLGEARAAAAIDGRLRRAGLHVAADIFTITKTVLWVRITILALALLGFLSYYWQPIIATCLFGLATLLSILAWKGIWPEMLLTGAKSQNVVAIEVAENAQTQRIVLLAALDSPPPSTRIGRRLAKLAQQEWLLVLSTLALVVIALLALLIPLRLWLFVMALPFLLLISMLALNIVDRYARQSPGAIHHAGPLGVMLACSDSIDNLQTSELWAVALGASSCVPYGLQDLLRRYPFDTATTLFIVLEGLGTGQLCYAVHTAQHEHFNERIAELMQSSSEISLCQAEQGLVPELIERGFACIGLYAHDALGKLPLYASPDDTIEHLDAEQLLIATKFVSELVQGLDNSR